MASRAAWWGLAGMTTLLPAGCKSVPDLVYSSEEAGSQPEGDAGSEAQNPADGQAGAEGGADGSSSSEASDGSGDGDAVAGDAAADATTDAGTDGGWTNTCPGTVPPGATRCDGNTACFERRAGDCSSASSDCVQQCGTTKICCINSGGNLFCRPDPSQCP
jgi:hypothetical protein